MVQVGIPIVGGLDRFTKGSWSIRGNFLTRSPITGIEPIVLLDWDIAVIGDRGPNADRTSFELGKVSMNTLDTFQMTLTGCCAEARHRHNGSLDIKASNLDYPLECTDEGLVDINPLVLEKLGCVEFWVISLDEG